MKGLGESFYHGINFTISLAGTDEKAIRNILAYRSCAQRQEIKLKFKSMYGRVSGMICWLAS